MLETEQKTGAKLRLHPLASTIRQVLSQCAPKSLAALALLAGLSAEPASAATINVNASCTLVDAITAANSNAAKNGCPAGSGADTIVLPANSVQTLATDYYANTGLPVISSAITIAGNGSTIQRDPLGPGLRAFFVKPLGNLTLNSTTVSGGYALNGGGIFNYGTVVLNNSSVSGNTAVRIIGSDGKYVGGFGGGIVNVHGTLTLNNSTVSGNSGKNVGGGLMNLGNAAGTTGVLTLNNSTVSGNSAAYHGGGLVNYYGPVVINNSTLSGNSAYLSGGGVTIFNGTVTLNSSTVSGNTADMMGGGVFNAGNLNLSRSLVSGNTSSPGAEVYNATYYGALVSADNHNLFGHDGSSGVDGFTPGVTDIVPTKSLNAILKPLGSNGGLTQTHLLAKGSPAINAIPTAECTAKTDQRGVARPQGTACDIGAVEVTFCDTAAPTRGCTVNGVANQRCEGTDASDTIVGTGGNDIIRGLGGNDILKGGGGNDKVCGGLGNDRLEGGIGLDQLFGGFGADRLLGGDGDDSLFGEQDNDNLDGGLGADKLNGGPGSKDTCLSDGSDTSKVGCEL